MTATICMTPCSSRRCTRWRTAASDRPTVLADGRVGAPAVRLQDLDDRPGGVVEHDPGGPAVATAGVRTPRHSPTDSVVAQHPVDGFRRAMRPDRPEWPNNSAADRPRRRNPMAAHTLENFIGGEHRAADRRPHAPTSSTRARARSSRTAPLSVGRPTSTPPARPRPGPSRPGGDTTPAERQLALLPLRRRARGPRRRARRRRGAEHRQAARS